MTWETYCRECRVLPRSDSHYESRRHKKNAELVAKHSAEGYVVLGGKDVAYLLQEPAFKPLVKDGHFVPWWVQEILACPQGTFLRTARGRRLVKKLANASTEMLSILRMHMEMSETTILESLEAVRLPRQRRAP